MTQVEKNRQPVQDNLKEKCIMTNGDKVRRNPKENNTKKLTIV